MHPYVFKSDFFSLHWENVMMIVGVLAGLWLTHRRAAYKGAAYQDMLISLATWLIVGGIVGARAWEMIWTWNEYVDDPWARFAVWEGGMSIQGSLLGGLLVAIWFAYRRKLRLWELLDILAPGVILGMAIGRIGCFLSGDAFGRPAFELAWYPQWLAFVYHPQSPAFSVYGPVKLVPAELFEMVTDLVILAFLLMYRPKHEVSGRVALSMLILYSVARFGLEFLRADSLMFLGLKVAQLLSLATIVAAAWCLLYRYRIGTSSATVSK